MKLRNNVIKPKVNIIDSFELSPVYTRHDYTYVRYISPFLILFPIKRKHARVECVWPNSRRRKFALDTRAKSFEFPRKKQAEVDESGGEGGGGGRG